MNHKKISLWLRHDRSTQGHPILSRRIFLTEIIVVFFGLVLFLQACDRVEATREGENISLTTMISVPSMARPPIDGAAPAKTETATFALG